MFLRVLKLLILPLIVTSLVSALSQTDAREAEQMGLLTLGYYALTTTIAAITGIVLVMTIHPGDPMVKGGVGGSLPAQQRPHASTLDMILDVIR
ncbi:excitatory amino acid transporter [Aphelenchoides avenae]|nr:excitatory amino acid transporter [Aphelenchus avenae]